MWLQSDSQTDEATACETICKEGTVTAGRREVPQITASGAADSVCVGNQSHTPREPLWGLFRVCTSSLCCTLSHIPFERHNKAKKPRSKPCGPLGSYQLLLCMQPACSIKEHMPRAFKHVHTNSRNATFLAKKSSYYDLAPAATRPQSIKSRQTMISTFIKLYENFKSHSSVGLTSFMYQYNSIQCIALKWTVNLLLHSWPTNF